MACVFSGGSAGSDWFGCNSDNRPPLCSTPHNSLINAVRPKIAPLQHEIELNHLDTICNLLEMSKKRGNIINNLKENHLFWFRFFKNVDEVISSYAVFIWHIMHFIGLWDATRDVACKVSILHNIYLFAILISCWEMPMSPLLAGKAIQIFIVGCCVGAADH